jgi:hypothetical protein
MTYMERAATIACESDVVVQVLLSTGNDDIEFILLRPQSPAEYITREEFTSRKLRSVGVVGLLSGLKPVCVFKEPLESSIVGAIAHAFAEYVRVLLLGESAEQIAAAEVAELERIYTHTDTRHMN